MCDMQLTALCVWTKLNLRSIQCTSISVQFSHMGPAGTAAYDSCLVVFYVLYRTACDPYLTRTLHTSYMQRGLCAACL